MTDYEKLFATAGFAFFSSLMATFAVANSMPAEDKLALGAGLAVIYAGTAMFTEWCKQENEDEEEKRGKVRALVCLAAPSIAAAIKPF